MAKLALLFLQIVIAASAVLTKSIKTDGDFIFIGSYKSEAVVQDGTIPNNNENNYFVSANSAIWNAADGDCRAHLGPNATLVAIESDGEWEFIKLMLENYGSATTYWTSGRYDSARPSWVWAANNQPFAPFAPWSPGHPGNPNALLRVILRYTSRFDAYWQAVPNTQLHRYICELQHDTIAVPCYRTNDLAIVLDASGSVGAANFVKALDFVDQLTTAFTRHSESRLTYIVYSTDATTRIPLTNTHTPAQISSIITTTPYTGGGTATHLGIDAAVAQFNGSPRQLPRNLIVLTDGESNNRALTEQAANRAISLGIRTFSVGITPSVNMQELLAIAGNDPARVFTSANFENLIKLLAPLSLKICP